jgi:hypothetical protein
MLPQPPSTGAQRPDTVRELSCLDLEPVCAGLTKPQNNQNNNQPNNNQNNNRRNNQGGGY